jgi:ABC-type uncharacterized transport system ATPase subunit
MAKFTVCYMATGGVSIEAKDEDQAREIFNKINDKGLLDELEANGIEITEVFADRDEEGYFNKVTADGKINRL